MGTFQISGNQAMADRCATTKSAVNNWLLGYFVNSIDPDQSKRTAHALSLNV